MQILSFLNLKIYKNVINNYMRIKSLIIYVIALFIGVNASYARKIIYSKNIIYNGEAIKSENKWIPQGQGSLIFSRDNITMAYLNPGFTYFKIDGQFDNSKVTSAVLSMVESNNFSDAKNLGAVFEGELSFTIKSEGKISLGDISISFEKGKMFERIKSFSPFNIDYGYNVEDQDVAFTAELSNYSNMDVLDPYGIKSGVNYTTFATVIFHVRREKFSCSVKNPKVVWDDGAVAEIKPLLQVTRGNKRWFDIKAEEGDDAVVTSGTAVLAVYNKNEQVVYPIQISDYAARAFKNHFSRVLSDGTIIRGVHEDNIPHVRYVKCIDGQVFEGKGELGVIIKGGETMSSLYANKSLTKDDIKLFNGTLYDANGEEIDSFGNGIGYYGEFPVFD